MRFDEFSEIVLREFPGLTGGQMEMFREMEGLYGEWNSKINVISRKDFDGFYQHHVLHSLAIAAYWRREMAVQNGLTLEQGLSVADGMMNGKREEMVKGMMKGKSEEVVKGVMKGKSEEMMKGRSGERVRVLDVGTGGGFPGIPLAVVCPEVRFTLCDSIGKKTKVAAEVARALGLENVEVVNARAESLPEAYDFVVSRAVTTLDNFYPWVKGKFRGSIFYLKGGDVNEEIATLMAHQKLRKGSVKTWRVDSWLEDKYFEEKFVIQIEKDYLCSPIVGNI